MPGKTIMLVCTAGMSSSLLVSNMQKVADEKKLNVAILAVSESEVEEKLKTKPVDILLLGPQVRHLKDRFTTLSSTTDGFIVKSISNEDFRTMNGERILDTALKLLADNESPF